jgi:hypothetical protein
LVPSLTVITLFAKIPRVRRVVPAFNGTVPVPVAGRGAVASEVDEPDVPEELELPDDDEEALELLCDDVVLLEPPLMESSALCTADVSWELTRLSAAWLAMLARPADSVVEAPNILLMTALVCAWAWLALAARAQ